MDKVRGNKLAIILFMLPATVLFFGIIVVPIIMSTYYSTLDWDGLTKSTFIGFKNYAELMTSKSVGFPRSMSNAIILAVLSTFVRVDWLPELPCLLLPDLEKEYRFR